jgi:hypothetical protein
MVPSGLEEDCVFNPQRVLVLRRVQVEAAAARAASRKAVIAQARAEQAKAASKANKQIMRAASGGRGSVSPTSISPGPASPMSTPSSPFSAPSSPSGGSGKFALPGKALRNNSGCVSV